MKISELQTLCGDSAEAKGWHEDRPKLEEFEDDFHGHNFKAYSKAVLQWRLAKIMLMVTELAEAVEELRVSNEVDTYYNVVLSNDGKGTEVVGTNPKPEGVPSELADVIIRIMDFCYTEGIDMEGMIAEKLAYNATREHRHGGKGI